MPSSTSTKHRKTKPQVRQPARPRAPRAGYLLKLFIAGMSSRSVEAIQSIKRICDRQFGADYNLEIVDLYREPGRAAKEQIIALPTLIKKKPEPIRRIIGSMGDEARVTAGLGVKHK